MKTQKILVKVSKEEKKLIKLRAEWFTKGNVSRLLIEAALNYVPKKRTKE